MSAATDKIRFHYLDVQFSFRQRSRRKEFLLSIFRREKKLVDSINYIFCTDEYLLSINQQYLKHDTYTDIVTFEISEPGAPVLSDIYISIDRVQENARLLEVTFTTELLRVMIHGVLHLCGYKDKSSVDKKVMTSKEDFYLKLLDSVKD